MPIVELCFSSGLRAPLVRMIADLVPFWVAEALTVEEPGGGLSSQDVEVWARPRHGWDISTYNIELVIRAKYFKAREEKLDAAATAISHYLKAEVRKAGYKGVKGSVFILLSPASFADFYLEPEETSFGPQ